MTLFEPLRLGPLTLRNRLVMAPMSRHRAPGRMPHAMTVEYYRQRAGAGLIVSESTAVSEQGASWVASPGIYSAQQVQAWAQVTQAVHREGGLIFCQLFHCGRCSSATLHGTDPPVAPSALAARGHIVPAPGDPPQPYTLPRALASGELPDIADQFRRATASACDAGFDGVELHAANGFLLDQFLRDGSNRRDDAHGGSLANRLRLLRACVSAAAEVIDVSRIGVRISPVNGLNDMQDSQPAELALAIAEAMSADGVGYLHVVEGALGVAPVHGAFDPVAVRKAFRGVYIANNGYDGTRAAAAIAEGHADLVAFGRLFIANPDLVERLRHGWPLNGVDPSLAAARDHRGYTDYPRYTASGRSAQPQALLPDR